MKNEQLTMNNEGLSMISMGEAHNAIIHYSLFIFH